MKFVKMIINLILGIDKDHVSKHMSKDEIACHCGCGQDSIDKDLIKMFEDFRAEKELPLLITNCNRCLEHNRRIGSKDTSQHVLGKAVDLHCPSMNHADLVKLAKLHHKKDGILSGGLGVYSNFIHVDTGSFRSWKG